MAAAPQTQRPGQPGDAQAALLQASVPQTLYTPRAGCHCRRGEPSAHTARRPWAAGVALGDAAHVVAPAAGARSGLTAERLLLTLQSPHDPRSEVTLIGLFCCKRRAGKRGAHRGAGDRRDTGESCPADAADAARLCRALSTCQFAP